MNTALPPATDRSGSPLSTILRNPGLLLVCLLFAVLAIGSLSINVVQVTGGIKGDEASYVAMALSVAHDGDLAYKRDDLIRFFRTYGSGPEGIFLKPGQGHAAHDDRLFFAKSFIYPLFAAPFAKLAGLNGLLLFNIILLAVIFLCAYLFAVQRVPQTSALIIATGFLGGSIAPLYALHLTSEIFNTALVFVAYFYWLYKEVSGANNRDSHNILSSSASDLISASLIGLATFSKLSNLPLIVPVVALSWWRRQARHGTVTLFVFMVIVTGCFGINAFISGEANFQGGEARKTFYGRFPFEQPNLSFDTLGTSVVTNDIRVDISRASVTTQLTRNVVYFFVGRHFGFLPYFFPGLLILTLVLFGRKKLTSWQILIVACISVSALGLLVLLPNTWSGGGGPLGNRYFLSFYPAFFFLLPTMRSTLPGIAMWIGGTLFTAQIIVNPFVATKQPWLVTQQGLLRFLPVELTMVNDLPIRLNQRRSRIPYKSEAGPELFLYYLDNYAMLPEPSGFWISGRAHSEIIVRAAAPIEKLTVTLRSPIDNSVRVRVDGLAKSIALEAGKPIHLTFPVVGVHGRGAQNFVLSVKTENGFIPRLRNETSNDRRFLGAMVQLSPTLNKKK